MKIPQKLLQESAFLNNHLANLDKNEKPIPDRFLVHLREYTPLMKEGKTKDFEVTSKIIPAGEPQIVVSMKQWFMTGYKPLKISFETETKIYQLRSKQSLLMSDSPQELFMQFDMVNKARGVVLTSGLGLGLFTRMVAMKQEVKEVIVVEKEKQIIDLFNKTKHPIFQDDKHKIRIIHDDIFNFLKTTKEKFDYIYLDIHYQTGCTEYINTVLPLRKILDKRFKGIPADFWAEDEMKAQYDPNFKNIAVKK
jgi:hypothetical protein